MQILPRPSPETPSHLVARISLTAALLMAPKAALATVMVEAPLEEMVARADSVVVGRVMRTGSVLSAEPTGPMPLSVTTVAVERWLKGDGPERVTIEERGGTWLDKGVRIDGTPTYRTGERVLLFLSEVPDRRHRYRTFALAQGKFSILPGTRSGHVLLGRDLSQLSLMLSERRAAFVQRAPPARVISLREVEELLAAQRVRRLP